MDEHDAMVLAALALSAQATRTLAVAMSALVERRRAGAADESDAAEAHEDPPADHLGTST